MRTRAVKKILLIATIVLLAADAGLGDEIVKKNGGRIRGKVVSQTPEEVVIKVSFRGGGEMEMRVPMKDIRSITVDGKTRIIGGDAPAPKRTPRAPSSASRRRTSASRSAAGNPKAASVVHAVDLMRIGKAFVLPEVEPITEDELIKVDHGRKSYKTTYPGVKYIVMVPNSYSPDRPAGLLLYYHGGRGVTPGEVANPWFHTIEGEGGFGGENLIWLKMSFENNATAGSTQFDGTLYALAKVFATYKIIQGRGVLTGFSAGGRHISYFVNQTGGWPFCHIVVESGLMYSSFPQGVRPMSWTLAVSQQEWVSWQLGVTAFKRIRELSNQLNSRGASWDIHYHVIAGEGHSATMNRNTLQASLAAFRRADTFIAPFVYAPDYAEVELKSAVSACTERRLGDAVAALARASRGPRKVKAKKLLDMVNARVEKMITYLKALKEKDPVVAAAYAKIVLGQLNGHAKGREVAQFVESLESDKAFKGQKKTAENWYSSFSTFVDNNATVHMIPNMQKTVEAFRDGSPEGSLIHRMAKEFLLLLP